MTPHLHHGAIKRFITHIMRFPTETKNESQADPKLVYKIRGDWLGTCSGSGTRLW